jgi:hypothetical protein
MSFTLNEVESVGSKAARGAGLNWGLAEEAGKAARWLAARWLPGPGLLAGLLVRIEGLPYADLAPISVDEVWTAGSGVLCPLIAGATLADRAAEIVAGREFALAAAAYPLLLAPYAEIIAGQGQITVELAWPGVTLAVSPDGGFELDGSDIAVVTATASQLQCRAATDNIVNPAPEIPVRCAVDASVWAVLNRFAQRTYAPATVESRELGAGADLIDSE